MMEEGMDIPSSMPTHTLSDTEVKDLYAKGSAYLKTRVSYVFESDKKRRHEQWTVATWG